MAKIMNIKLYTLILLLLVNTLMADPKLDNTMPSTLFERINDAIDIEFLWENFEMDIKGPILCDGPGIEFTFVEPVYVFETNRDIFAMHSLGLVFNTDLTGQGNTRTSDDDGGRANVYANLVKFPLLRLIFGESSLNGILCFMPGSLDIGYHCALDPTKSCRSSLNGLRLMADMVEFFTPGGLMSMITDCTMATASSFSKNTATDFTADVFYWNTGCHGFNNTTGAVMGIDPIADNETQLMRVLNLLHKLSIGSIPGAGIARKTYDGAFGSSVRCKPGVYGVAPKSNYHVQLIYPTVGKVLPIGVTAAASTTYKNRFSNNDAIAKLVWRFRSQAMTYECTH
jgi:hypothetical protein